MDRAGFIRTPCSLLAATAIFDGQKEEREDWESMKGKPMSLSQVFRLEFERDEAS
jgi:hypothetical protein